MIDKMNAFISFICLNCSGTETYRFVYEQVSVTKLNRLRRYVLHRARWLFDMSYIPKVPCELSLTERSLDIEDPHVDLHDIPCNMCDKSGPDCGPRCVWICCGFLACQKCALHFYKCVMPYGRCPACECVFPAGWNVYDILRPPPARASALRDSTLSHLKAIRRVVLAEKGDFDQEILCTHMKVVLCINIITNYRFNS